MAKFIVTSDWHIGARMGSAGRAATRFRETKFATVERILGLAGETGARALFLLGDTFDGDGVGAGEIERTVELLTASPCPVFVLPGNHDWWHAGGALSSFARKAERAENISVLTEMESPLTLEGIPGVTFYPCPVLRHAEVTDPTVWIPVREPGDGLRIALIHGALDRADWGGNVPEQVAEKRDLDLALLGDWHKPVDGPDGRTFYAGSIEPGGFDEGHVGQVLVGTADDGRALVSRVPVGRLCYRRIELLLESSEIDGAGPSVLRSAAETVSTEPSDTALRLRLTGKLTPSELDVLDGILAEQREADWAECDISSEVDLLGEPDLAGFEEDSVRAVAERIWEGEAEPAVRRRALAILAAKAEEVR